MRTTSPSRNSPCEHAHRQRVEHPPLDRPLQRPRAVGRIVALGDQQILGAVGQLDVDLAILEPLHQAAQLDVDDRPHLLAAERVEEDDLVDPVEELRPEVRAQRLDDLRAARLRRAPCCRRGSTAASAMKWLPTFDVMITTVFLKSTVRPLPSVSRPSSSSCSITLSTSGCAFSISSKSTTA